MSKLTLTAEGREVTGRKVRRLRENGLVPMIVYGQATDPLKLQMDARSLEAALQKGAGAQLVELSVAGGKTHNVLMRELQRDPVSRKIVHADFYAVNMREKQVVHVTIHQTGKPEEMEAGLMVLQALDNVEIEALPADIPAYVEVDITSLTLENTITVADLPSIPGVEYLTPVEETVFTMVVPRAAVEDETDEEALEDGDMVVPELVGEDEEASEDEE
ncbi:MAG: 50S ribosomal protein L25 [Caldilineaceae bacterium]|nr:50S ribosomal protein L25 [Caldilineaceae bacterium]MCB9140083.1 50S ribosomal protein L25 [Caldilineaceae bacterium]